MNDVAGVQVFVKVDEGPSYELGKVEIAGPSPVDPALLLKAGDFKTGDVANFDRVNDGLERIRKAVWRAGYLHAKVTNERKIDDEKKTVGIAVHVNAGPQYLMGKPDASGPGSQRRGGDQADLGDEGWQGVQSRVPGPFLGARA